MPRSWSYIAFSSLIQLQILLLRYDEILENFTYHCINHLFSPSVLIPVWVGRHNYWLLVYDDHVEVTQSLSSQRLRPPFLPPQRRVQCLTFLWLFGPLELWLQDLASYYRWLQPQCSLLLLGYLVHPWNFAFSCTLWLWELWLPGTQNQTSPEVSSCPVRIEAWVLEQPGSRVVQDPSGLCR